jgi:hypothetical protein
LIIITLLSSFLISASAEGEACNYKKVSVRLDSDKSPWNDVLKTDVTVTVTVPVIVVLANSIDYPRGIESIGLLRNDGFEVFHNTASVFEACKEGRLILIMGGPDAPEGVGDIVREVLSDSEEEALREKGAKKVFIKSNIWAPEQKIIIVAGSDRENTKDAFDEQLNLVLDEANEFR